jgi:putative glutamine amidotransferase
MRDAFELALAAGAEEREIPLLAICRGLQLLNVLRGGTLVQHLPDAIQSERHALVAGQFNTVEVDVFDGTRLAGILGSGRLVVECSHHQAIGRIGENLVIGARATDGVIEGVEDPSMGFMVGVQWHPEAGGDRRLFSALVAAC